MPSGLFYLLEPRRQALVAGPVTNRDFLGLSLLEHIANIGKLRILATVLVRKKEADR